MSDTKWTYEKINRMYISKDIFQIFLDSYSSGSHLDEGFIKCGLVQTSRITHISQLFQETFVCADGLANLPVLLSSKLNAFL